MDIERKKELLNLADSISKDINNQGCGNYVPKIINSINIAKKKSNKSLLQEILNKMKNTEFGGNAQKEGFKSFVNEIFKNPKYEINSLDFEELEFVFSWVRRIVKDPPKGNNQNSDRKRNSFNQNNSSDFSRSLKNSNYNHNNIKKNNNNNRNKFNKTEESDLNNSPFSVLLNLKDKLE